MRFSSRFWLYAPLLLLLGLAAWTGLYWWSAASALDRELDAMKGRDAIPGVKVDWRAKTLSGFPFRLDAVFDGFSVKGAGAHGPFAWHSERFAIHALTYGPAKKVYEAAGRQQLAWTDADGAAHSIAFLPGALHASSVVRAGSLSRFDLDIADAGSKKVMAGRFQFHMRRDPGSHTLDLMLRADSVQAMGQARTPARNVEASVSLSDAAAFAPLLRGKASWPAAMQAWRSAGGTARASQPVAPGLSPTALLSPRY
jgi:hypothetical protein